MPIKISNTLIKKLPKSEQFSLEASSKILWDKSQGKNMITN